MRNAYDLDPKVTDENPVITHARALGFNRAEFATYTILSRSTMEYIEEGAYGPLPISVVQALSILEPDIQTKYKQWKMRKRLRANLPALPTGFPSLDDMMHPHVEWREAVCGLSSNKYAERLCVYRILVQQFENGKLKNMPAELRRAMTIACGSETTEKVRKACLEWSKDAANTEGTDARAV